MIHEQGKNMGNMQERGRLNLLVGESKRGGASNKKR